MNIMNRGKTLSVAESCTGGKICNEMAKIPGISKIFLLGIVAYSNNSKISFNSFIPSLKVEFEDKLPSLEKLSVLKKLIISSD